MCRNCFQHVSQISLAKPMVSFEISRILSAFLAESLGPDVSEFKALTNRTTKNRFGLSQKPLFFRSSASRAIGLGCRPVSGCFMFFLLGIVWTWIIISCSLLFHVGSNVLSKQYPNKLSGMFILETCSSLSLNCQLFARGGVLEYYWRGSCLLKPEHK